MSDPDTVESVLVIGAGVAGVTTVTSLRRGGFEGAITVVEATGMAHDRPPLSKEFLAEPSNLAGLELLPAKTAAELGIEVRLDTPVASLDAEARAVTFADGSVAQADWIVLATGARAALPTLLSAESERVHVIRELDDAQALAGQLSDPRKVVVLGAGLLGAEIAGTLVGLGHTVTLVDPNPFPLAEHVGEPLAKWLHDLHGRSGARVHTTALLGVVHGPDESRLRLADGTELAAELVVAAVGMVPATDLAVAAGLEGPGGTVVDLGQRTVVPGILAVGDASFVKGVPGGHWDAAKESGERAAATILGQEPVGPGVPWFWSDRHGVHLDVVGKIPLADRTVVRGEFGVPPFSVFGFEGDRLVSFAGIDEARLVRPVRRAIDAQVRLDPDSLLDPAANVRKLLKP